MQKTKIDEAAALIFESIKSKSPNKDIKMENLKFVIDDKPFVPTAKELGPSDCKVYVCYVVHGELVCGWEPC